MNSQANNRICLILKMSQSIVKLSKFGFHIGAFLDLLRNISAKKFSKTKVAKKSVKDFLATEVDQICKKEKKSKKKETTFSRIFFSV